MRHEMRFPAILEIEFQIFQNYRLIAFDGEMVMRLALGDQIVGQLALRQQGIGTDLLARYLDGLEQWDGGLDHVDRRSVVKGKSGDLGGGGMCRKKKGGDGGT